RKGGDIAIRIIEYLNHKEFPVQLFLIGVEPPQSLPIPNNVIKVGYINKMISGSRILSDYYEKSHFLLLPTRAEAFGIVLCEANSCGLPCIQRTWGGLRRL
ncbi:MAG: glycosyltransferase, partial [Gammaproteobacteria bacterium]|nr:glycosyltransferase [Gammaproteobacteria bacterium]